MATAMALYERDGSEFTLNGTTAGTQSLVKIAWISSTRYIAVWTHDEMAGGVSDPQIRARMFDSGGAPVGGEFTVNGSDAGIQTNAVVAKLAGGGFVIAWEDRNTASDGSGASIRYQRFDDTGGKVGPEGIANTTVAADQTRPSIAGLETGGFAITWTDASASGGDTSGLAVRGQLFSSIGDPVGAEFLVNTLTNRNQTASSIVGLPGGGFAVVWQDESPQGVSSPNMSREDHGSDIAMQIFDSAGNKVSPQQVVDIGDSVGFSFGENGRLTAMNPVAALLPGGKIAVAWTDALDGMAKTRLFDVTGQPATGVFDVGLAAGTLGSAPAIAVLANGGYAVSWSDNRTGLPDASGRGVLARVFDAAGAPQGAEFQLNSSTAGNQTAPALLGLPAGGFLAAWHDETTSDIGAQLFRTDSGAISDISLSVSSISKGAIENVQAAILSADGALNGVFTYELLGDPTGAFRIVGDRLVVADTHRLHGFSGSSVTLSLRATDSNGNSYTESVEIPLTPAPATALYEARNQYIPIFESQEGSGAQTPEIVALPNGRFFLTWAETRLTTGSFEIMGQFHEANGTYSLPFVINTATHNTQLEPAATLLANGTLVVTWTSAVGSQNQEVRAQILDSAGAKVGAEIAVNTVTLGIQIRAEPMALADGGFIVTWYDNNLDTNDPTRGDIKTQFFTASGAKIGGEIVVNTTTASFQVDPSAAQLASGNIVIAWRDDSATGGDTSGGAVRAQILSSTGTPVGSEFLVNSTTLHHQQSPVVTALSGGGFVIVWRDSSEGTGSTSEFQPGDLRAQIYDASGSRVGGEILVNTETLGAQGHTSLGAAGVSAHPSGGFVVTWTSYAQVNSDGSGGAVKAQMFAADGSRVGSEFLVNQVGHNQQSSPKVAFLNDGDMVFTFWDLSASNGTGGGRAIGIRRFDYVGEGATNPPIVGTAGNDNLGGTDGNDRIEGKEGNDTLTGHGGDDVLIGGPGDDSYVGGDGTDTVDYSGEAGPVAVNLHHSLFFFPSGHPFATRSLFPGEALDGAGNYESMSGVENLVLTSGDDRVLGSDGANRVEAGAGHDQIRGMGGDDVVLGGDGHDLVFGGAGSDDVEGGEGDDTVYGDADDDVLAGGGGTDFLYGGTGNDSLSGEDGNDFLRSEDGDDSLDGGDGNDLLRGGAGVDSFEGGANPAGSTGWEGLGDRISFFETRATQGVVADLRTGIISNDGFGNRETMSGIESLGADTAFADTFYGNDERNGFIAGRGDVVYGFGGDDRVETGGVAAFIDGGDGLDMLLVRSDGGFLLPDGNGDGVAEISGASTTGYTVNLASGTMDDGLGNFGTVLRIENVEGSAAADTLIGDGAVNRLDGGAGDDVVLGGGGNDHVLGGAGNDLVRGEEGDDAVDGGEGNDNLRGGSGVDTFDGGSNDEERNLISGYADRVSFFERSATQAAVADLRTGIISNDGFGNSETMVNVESLGGDTAFADTFHGNDSSNFISGSRGDFLYGHGGDDAIAVSAVAGVVDGGDGLDVLELNASGGFYLPDSNGDGLAELAAPMSVGWTVDLAARTYTDGYGTSGSFTGIEALRGSDLADNVRGSIGTDLVDGAGGDDFLRLEQGGDDAAAGGAGRDAFYFGGALTSADVVDGGTEVDQIAIQGNYTGVGKLTLGAIFDVEQFVLLSGTDTRFGAPGGVLYSYDVTTTDQNVAAGQQMQIDGVRLRAGENFTFDGSAEMDGSFIIWAGKGTDILKGGSGNDGFLFRGTGNWSASDSVVGGAGIDQLGLRGNYAGANAVVMGATQISGIEVLALMSGTDTRFGAAIGDARYDVTMHDGNLAAGARMTVDATFLRTAETLLFNGSAESDGSFRIFGGQAADIITGSQNGDSIRGGLGGDVLTGAGGADTFLYRTAADSTGANFDTLVDFNSADDKIDLATSVSGSAGTVGAGRLDAATFDSDLAAALDGLLGPNQAILFNPDQGSFAGRKFLIVDGNGDGAYTLGQDYVFELGAGASVDLSGTAFFV
jgi:Ca2+-binding RTX toxin-like protein